MEGLTLIGIGASLFCANIAWVMNNSRDNKTSQAIKYLFIIFGIIFILQSYGSGVAYTYYQNDTISNLDFGETLSSGITASYILLFVFMFLVILYLLTNIGEKS